MTSVRLRVVLLVIAGAAALFAFVAGTRALRAPSASDVDAVPGRLDVVLWHSLDPESAAVLDGLLERFTTLYPGIRVRSFSIPRGRMAQRATDLADAGLGPDVLLVSNVDLRSDLAGLVADVSDTGLLDDLKPLAVDTVRDGSRVLGVPLAVETHILYYDTSRIAEPAPDLVTLLDHVRGGHGLALPTSFFDAAWGIGAYGGTIRTSLGSVALNQGGFEAWLRWLLEVQALPNTVLSPDQDELVRRFAAGGLSYLVASSADLPYLRRALGARVAAAPLPDGPSRSARPYLVTEVLALGRYLSPAQRAAAEALTAYLAAPQQQRAWMVELARVPSNVLVGINRFALPAVHAARLQSFTTLPFRGDQIDQELVFGLGDDVYTRVLAGVLEPEAAPARFEALNVRAGLPAAPSARPMHPGVVR